MELGSQSACFRPNTFSAPVEQATPLREKPRRFLRPLAEYKSDSGVTFIALLVKSETQNPSAPGAGGREGRETLAHAAHHRAETYTQHPAG